MSASENEGMKTGKSYAALGKQLSAAHPGFGGPKWAYAQLYFYAPKSIGEQHYLMCLGKGSVAVFPFEVTKPTVTAFPELKAFAAGTRWLSVCALHLADWHKVLDGMAPELGRWEPIFNFCCN